MTDLTTGQIANAIASKYAFDLRGQVGALSEDIAKAIKEARFAPLGDNHHNAAVCPYCNPKRDADLAQAESRGMKAQALRDFGDDRMTLRVVDGRGTVRPAPPPGYVYTSEGNVVAEKVFAMEVLS